MPSNLLGQVELGSRIFHDLLYYRRARVSKSVQETKLLVVSKNPKFYPEFIIGFVPYIIL